MSFSANAVVTWENGMLGSPLNIITAASGVRVSNFLLKMLRAATRAYLVVAFGGLVLLYLVLS